MTTVPYNNKKMEESNKVASCLQADTAIRIAGMENEEWNQCRDE